MCKFCEKFDFSSARIVDGGIRLAVGSTKYPEKEQFNFCPVCGRFLKVNDGSKS